MPVRDILLFISEPPQFPPTEREKMGWGGGDGGRRLPGWAPGTWSVFRRKTAVSSCQSWAFWCHRLGAGLSVSWRSSYQRRRLAAEMLAPRWKHTGRFGTLAHLHLAHKLWRESGSVNYEGAQTFSPEDGRERKQCIGVMQQSLQWIKARRNDSFFFCFYSLRSLLALFFRLNGKSFHVSVQWLHVVSFWQTEMSR